MTMSESAVTLTERRNLRIVNEVNGMVNEPNGGDEEQSGHEERNDSEVPARAPSTDPNPKKPKEHHHYAQRAIAATYDGFRGWFWQRAKATVLSANFWTAFATVVIAAATIAYTRYAQRQWTAMNSTLSEIQKQTPEIQNQAKAAQNSVMEIQKQTEASERPWLAVDFSVPGGVSFDINGAPVGFDVRVRNLGHSPATNVVINPRVINRQRTGDVSEINALCEHFPKTVPVGETVFPTDDWTEHFGLAASPEELSKSKDFIGFRDNELLLSVIGCVTYFGSLSSEAHHTTFAYQLVNLIKDERGRGVTFKRNIAAPGNQIRADKWPMGNDAK